MKIRFIKGLKALSVLGVLALLCLNVSMYADLQKYRKIEQELIGEEKTAEYFYQKFKDYGREYKYRENSEHGMMCLGIAAHMGLDDAQAHLGGYLNRPLKNELSHAHGLHWIKKAAEQGKAKHQYCYATYIGFPVKPWEHPTNDERAKSEADCKTAFNLYRKAAEQGHLEAMIKTAQWYQCGYGGEKNLEEALRWAKKAYEIEREDGKNYEAYTIGAIYMEMGRPDLAEPYLELRAIYGDSRATALWYQAKQMLDKQKKSAEPSLN